MPPIRRFLQQPSCVFAYSFGDLADARRRFTVSGAPTIVDSPLGKAMRFDGAADYLTLTGMWEERLRFDAGTQDFSACAWVRRATIDIAGRVFDKRDGINDGWYLSIAANNVAYCGLNAIIASSPSTITDQLWHHLAFVVDRDGNCQVFLDGVGGGTVAVGGAIMATTAAPRIGANSYGAAGTRFRGDVHSIVIHNRIFSPQEVDDMARGRAF